VADGRTRTTQSSQSDDHLPVFVSSDLERFPTAREISLPKAAASYGTDSRPLPFWTDGQLTVYVGDCRDVMPYLPTVDAIVTDPPYGQTSLAWDVPVEDWLPLADRVLSPFGSMWIFGSLRSLSPLVSAAGSGALPPWRFAQDIVWEKHNGSSFHADRFRRVHEQAAHFYRGAWREIFRDPVTTPDATARTVRRKERPPHTGEIANSTYTSEDGGPRLMRSVLQVRSEHGRAIHPTQKPEGIIRPLVAYSTVPGGRVLDPFGGSLTTLSVARSLGMHGIAIEANEEYATAGIERLAQLTLDAAVGSAR
jgi:site-specific DNA-methyltransferase (adenine-specific)